MRRSRVPFWVPVFAATFWVLPGCGGPQTVEPTKMPYTEDARTGDSTFPRQPERIVEEDSKLAKPPSEQVEGLARSIINASPGGSVGCLPLVSLDDRGSGPRVSELGVRLAEDIASALEAQGYKGEALGVEEMTALLTQMNVQRVSLSSLPAVVEHGEKLGVDAVVFGTIRHERNVGRSGRDVLSVRVSAYDVSLGKVVAEQPFEISSERMELVKYWDLEKRDSLWLPGNGYNVPEVEQSLDRELRVAAKVLGNRALGMMDVPKIQGIIYIPPTDTSRFVKAVARVRSAQAAFAAEYARRAQEAERTGSPLDVARQVTLNDVVLPDFQAAEAYFRMLAEGLLATDAFIYGQQVSSMLAEVLIPRLTPHEVRVNDIGFTKWSDSQVVQGELATGGLARNLSARNAMKAAGIEFVLAPRFERYGKGFILRLEIFDLKTSSLSATMHFPIAPRFEEELAKDLGVNEVEPIADLAKAERSSWEAMYPMVASGVVQVAGSTGPVATGFVVSRDGLIMTNARVIRQIPGLNPSIRFSNGATELSTFVSADDFQDLALVRVPRMPEGTHVFQFAAEADARVGAEVAVLGQAAGTQGWAFAPGHLSSLKEQVVLSNGPGRPSYMYTCPVREGASGSPVLFVNGKVGAVNSLGSAGLSFTLADRTATTGFSFGTPGVAAQVFLSSVLRG